MELPVPWPLTHSTLVGMRGVLFRVPDVDLTAAQQSLLILMGTEAASLPDHKWEVAIILFFTYRPRPCKPSCVVYRSDDYPCT